MSNKNSWSDVEGSLEIECELSNGVLLDFDGKEIPQCLANAIKSNFDESNKYFTVLINFLSSGYYDPGQTYGPPENCYPPEGDDERLPDGVEIESNGKKVVISANESNEIFDAFYDKIMDVEIDCNNEYDYDYDYDE